MSRPGRARDEFVERNLFLFALLGLASHARQADAFIVRHLATPSAGAERTSSALSGRRGERALFAVLGAVAVSRALQDVLARWASEAESSSARVVRRADDPAHSPGSLLR